MSDALEAWNLSNQDSAVQTLLSCCYSRRWADTVVTKRPYSSDKALCEAADEVWSSMRESDWLEAFRAHPRIGEQKATGATAQSARWSSEEQESVTSSTERLLSKLAELNTRYENRFGFTYIVCATGRSAEEMLALLERRLDSDRDHELQEAAEQQRQIMQIRLRKWLQP